MHGRPGEHVEVIDGQRWLVRAEAVGRRCACGITSSAHGRTSARLVSAKQSPELTNACAAKAIAHQNGRVVVSCRAGDVAKHARKASIRISGDY
jgi:hypothetical protein